MHINLVYLIFKIFLPIFKCNLLKQKLANKFEQINSNLPSNEVIGESQVMVLIIAPCSGLEDAPKGVDDLWSICR